MHRSINTAENVFTITDPCAPSRPPVTPVPVVLVENASADQIAGADPDHPDSPDPGGGARDDPERMRRHPLVLQGGRQHIPVQKRGQASVHAHAGLPGSLWTGTFW